MKKKQREGSLNTEDTAKDIEIAINPIPHKTPIGQRNDNRFQVTNSKIALNKSSFFSSKSKVPHKTSLVNLSINGLQILTTEILKPGSKYNITLFAPSLAGSMNIKAKAIWSKIFRKEFTVTYYRVGFKFINTNKEIEDDLKKLESFSYVQNT
jgi:c-di-GMP-binding flagellar brake protein YcgR